LDGPPPNATCTLIGGNVDITLSNQPVEWDLPADNEIVIVYIRNGVEDPSAPFTMAAGVSSQIFGAFGDTVPGGYPITYAMRLDTYVGGALVYKSTLAFSCNADNASITPTITNEEVTPGSGGVTGKPGPDMVMIPDTAVVGAVVSTTPIYFAPRPGATSVTVLEAGKTIWVFGVDASGDFYKVMLSGQFFWVPVETMGPNNDAVWQGRPLPTGIVD
jgi:hypothetical protein